MMQPGQRRRGATLRRSRLSAALGFLVVLGSAGPTGAHSDLVLYGIVTVIGDTECAQIIKISHPHKFECADPLEPPVLVPTASLAPAANAEGGCGLIKPFQKWTLAPDAEAELLKPSGGPGRKGPAAEILKSW